MGGRLPPLKNKKMMDENSSSRANRELWTRTSARCEPHQVNHNDAKKRASTKTSKALPHQNNQHIVIMVSFGRKNNKTLSSLLSNPDSVLSREKVKDSIAGYESLFSGARHKVGETSTEDSIAGREKEYQKMVSSFYDLVTDFYEFGWGQVSRIRQIIQLQLILYDYIPVHMPASSLVVPFCSSSCWRNFPRIYCEI